MTIAELFKPKSIQHPFKNRTSGQTKGILPDNITYVKGQAFVQINRVDGFEADIWRGQTGQRTAELNALDLSIIEDRQLKETKYRTLKQYWASNLSAAQVSKILVNETGFGQRTIEKYWSAFSAANHSTIE